MLQPITQYLYWQSAECTPAYDRVESSPNLLHDMTA